MRFLGSASLPLFIMALEKTIYNGAFVHCESLTELEICTNGMIGVDEHGKISFVLRDLRGRKMPSGEGWEQAKVVRIQDHGFFFPGFIGIVGVNRSSSILLINIQQIRTNTPHNTPMLASLVSRRYWTG